MPDDGMAAVKAHEQKVQHQDLTHEIEKAKGELERVQAEGAKAKQQLKDEIAGLTAERDRLAHHEEPEHEEGHEPTVPRSLRRRRR